MTTESRPCSKSHSNIILNFGDVIGNDAWVVFGVAKINQTINNAKVPSSRELLRYFLPSMRDFFDCYFSSNGTVSRMSVDEEPT